MPEFALNASAYELRILRMYEYTNKKIQPLLLIILLILIDQLSKYIVRSWGGFYIYNRGIAFGLHLPFWLVLTTEFIFIFFIGFLIFPPKADQPLVGNQSSIYKFLNLKFISAFFRHDGLSYFPLILIFSGAISNMLDRLYYGCVIDFIELKFWPIFNLADSFITIGVIMTLYEFRNSDIKKLFRN